MANNNGTAAVALPVVQAQQGAMNNVVNPPPGLGILHVFPEEVLLEFVRTQVISGQHYTFRGLSKAQLDTQGGMPCLNLSRVSSRLRVLAIGVWLTQNEVTLQVTVPARSPRGRPASALQNILEDNIEWIVQMTTYALTPQITLKCRGCGWMLLPRVFNILKLVHEKEIFITVNCTRSNFHIANAPACKGINIEIRNSDKKPQAIILGALDLAHHARVQNQSLDQLKRSFNAHLSVEGWTPLRSLPRDLRLPRGYELNSYPVSCVYAGPNDLLYKTSLDAAESLEAVYDGNPPITSTLDRGWVSLTINKLRSWDFRLEWHSRKLTKALHTHTLPRIPFSHNTVFGYYGDNKWSVRPTTLPEIHTHINQCNRERQQAHVHIAAMMPYR